MKEVVRSANKQIKIFGVKYVKSPIKNSYNFFANPLTVSEKIIDNAFDFVSNTDNDSNSNFMLQQTPVFHNNMVKPEDYSNVQQSNFPSISSISSLTSDSHSMKTLSEELNLKSVSRKAIHNKNCSKIYFNNKVKF